MILEWPFTDTGNNGNKINKYIFFLTPKSPIMTAEENIIYSSIFFRCFSEKIRLDVSTSKMLGRGFT